MTKNPLLSKSGISLVETLLAITILAIFSVTITSLSINTSKTSAENALDTEAMLYAQEGLEAVRNLRDQNFLNLSNGDFGTELESGQWAFVQAPQTLTANFTRTITISDVYRDGTTGDISETGTILDADTKKVTSTVNWETSQISDSVEVTTYLSNWRGDSLLHTTCDDFDNGTYLQTETDTLPAPPTDNCTIKLEEITVPSTDLASADLGGHAEDVAIDGNYIFASVNKNNEGAQSINISDPLNPTVADTIDIGAKGTHISYDQSKNLVFVGTTKKNQELAIIDTSNANNLSLEYQINLPNFSNHSEIKSDNLFLAMDNNSTGLRSYDILASGNITELDSLDIYDKGQFIAIKGSYAYIGTASDTTGFVVVDINDPSNLSVESTLDVGEEVNAIAIQGNIAYVGTEDSSNSLQVVNISDVSNPSVITSLDVGGEIQDLTITGSYLYAAVDQTQAGLSAVDISTPSSPSYSYSLDISGKGSGIASDSNYIYTTTITANNGLVITGTTASATTVSGTYTSEIFDTGSTDPLYYFIDWDHNEVPGGNLEFQIRTANTAGSIDSATWVGSDGTGSTFYSSPRTPIILDTGRSGSRYVQYQAYFTSDGVNSPELNSVHINYAP